VLTVNTVTALGGSWVSWSPSPFCDLSESEDDSSSLFAMKSCCTGGGDEPDEGLITAAGIC